MLWCPFCGWPHFSLLFTFFNSPVLARKKDHASHPLETPSKYCYVCTFYHGHISTPNNFHILYIYNVMFWCPICGWSHFSCLLTFFNGSVLASKKEHESHPNGNSIQILLRLPILPSGTFQLPLSFCLTRKTFIGQLGKLHEHILLPCNCKISQTGKTSWLYVLLVEGEYVLLCPETGVKLFIRSKVQSMFLLWNLHSRGERGRKGRECKFQIKAHGTFHIRISCSGVTAVQKFLAKL